jgi:hypothetical protein
MHQLTNTFSRPDHLEKIKHLRIIDIGGSTSFADGHLEAIADFNQPLAKSKYFFQGNINLPEVWVQIHKHVKEHGKFDYAICTHTLEDISNPFFVCREIEKIASAGLIIVPSKYIELSRFNHFRGFIHHRWIFDFIKGQFTGFPKVNLIEHERFTHHIRDKNELIYEWQGAINLQLINNDWLGPDNAAVEGYYDQLIDWR